MLRFSVYNVLFGNTNGLNYYACQDTDTHSYYLCKDLTVIYHYKGDDNADFSDKSIEFFKTPNEVLELIQKYEYQNTLKVYIQDNSPYGTVVVIAKSEEEARKMMKDDTTYGSSLSQYDENGEVLEFELVEGFVYESLGDS